MKKILAFFCVIAILVTISSPVSATVSSVKADTKAPTIVKTYPADGSKDVMVESSIMLRFSETLRKGKNIAKVTLKEAGTTKVEFTYELSGNLITITPDAKLKYNTLYTVTVPASAVKDKAGNNFAKMYSFTFLTEKDPADTKEEVKTGSYQYILEIEANLDHKLTDIEVENFTQLLKGFGLDADISDYYLKGQENK